jgi:ATP-dependent Clp protease ATP-binding subunit ClpC
MQSSFETFTKRARKVVSLAQEEAQRFNHNYIGTEHLLLGLVRDGEGDCRRGLGESGGQPGEGALPDHPGPQPVG